MLLVEFRVQNGELVVRGLFDKAPQREFTFFEFAQLYAEQEIQKQAGYPAGQDGGQSKVQGQHMGSAKNLSQQYGSQQNLGQYNTINQYNPSSPGVAGIVATTQGGAQQQNMQPVGQWSNFPVQRDQSTATTIPPGGKQEQMPPQMGGIINFLLGDGGDTGGPTQYQGGVVQQQQGVAR